MFKDHHLNYQPNYTIDINYPSFDDNNVFRNHRRVHSCSPTRFSSNSHEIFDKNDYLPHSFNIISYKPGGSPEIIKPFIPKNNDIKNENMVIDTENNINNNNIKSDNDNIDNNKINNAGKFDESDKQKVHEKKENNKKQEQPIPIIDNNDLRKQVKKQKSLSYDPSITSNHHHNNKQEDLVRKRVTINTINNNVAIPSILRSSESIKKEFANSNKRVVIKDDIKMPSNYKNHNLNFQNQTEFYAQFNNYVNSFKSSEDTDDDDDYLTFIAKEKRNTTRVQNIQITSTKPISVKNNTTNYNKINHKMKCLSEGNKKTTKYYNRDKSYKNLISHSYDESLMNNDDFNIIERYSFDDILLPPSRISSMKKTSTEENTFFTDKSGYIEENDSKIPEIIIASDDDVKHDDGNEKESKISRSNSNNDKNKQLKVKWDKDYDYMDKSNEIINNKSKHISLNFNNRTQSMNQSLLSQFLSSKVNNFEITKDSTFFSATNQKNTSQSIFIGNDTNKKEAMLKPSSNSNKEEDAILNPPSYLDIAMPSRTITKKKKKSMDSKNNLREQVIKEIISSEKRYVSQLKILENIYIDPMSRLGLLTTEESSIVFSNIKAILMFHRDHLYPSMVKEGEEDEKEFGKMILSYLSFFKIYSEYYNNFEKSVNFIENLGTNIHNVIRRRRIKSYLKSIKSHPDHSQISLQGFLILPVQRLPRYRLLYRELIRYTPSTHPDFKCLKMALNKLEKLVSECNERKREWESTERGFQLLRKAVDDFVGYDINSRHIINGRFLKSDILYVQKMFYRLPTSSSTKLNNGSNFTLKSLTKSTSNLKSYPSSDLVDQEWINQINTKNGNNNNNVVIVGSNKWKQLMKEVIIKQNYIFFLFGDCLVQCTVKNGTLADNIATFRDDENIRILRVIKFDHNKQKNPPAKLLSPYESDTITSGEATSPLNTPRGSRIIIDSNGPSKIKSPVSSNEDLVNENIYINNNNSNNNNVKTENNTIYNNNFNININDMEKEINLYTLNSNFNMKNRNDSNLNSNTNSNNNNNYIPLSMFRSLSTPFLSNQQHLNNNTNDHEIINYDINLIDNHNNNCNSNSNSNSNEETSYDDDKEDSHNIVLRVTSDNTVLFIAGLRSELKEWCKMINEAWQLN